MSSVPDPKAAVRPRAPRRLLEDIAGNADRMAAAGRPRARVTLHLSTGRDLVGRLVAVGEDGGMVIAALDVGEGSDVVHVRVDMVAAVTLHEPQRHAGSVVDAPARLELDRLVEARGATLSAELGAELPLALDPAVASDVDRRAIGALLGVLDEALAPILRDPAGREAWRGKVNTVRLAAGDPPSARLIGGVLELCAARDELDRWSAAELRAAIDRQL